MNISNSGTEIIHVCLKYLCLKKIKAQRGFGKWRLTNALSLQRKLPHVWGILLFCYINYLLRTEDKIFALIIQRDSSGCFNLCQVGGILKWQDTRGRWMVAPRFYVSSWAGAGRTVVHTSGCAHKWVGLWAPSQFHPGDLPRQGTSPGPWTRQFRCSVKHA